MKFFVRWCLALIAVWVIVSPFKVIAHANALARTSEVRILSGDYGDDLKDLTPRIDVQTHASNLSYLDALLMRDVSFVHITYVHFSPSRWRSVDRTFELEHFTPIRFAPLAFLGSYHVRFNMYEGVWQDL